MTHTSLRWLHGITLNTRMQDIGWVYVILAVALAFIGWCVYQLVSMRPSRCPRCGLRHG